MKTRKMLVLVGTLFVVFASLTVNVEAAAKFPEKDIVFICPAKPGGGSGITAQLFSRYLPKYLPNKVNVIVQTMDAAGGRVGSFAVYDAKPDGYTIGVVEPTTYVMAEILGDPKKREAANLTWLGRASAAPYALATYPQGPIKTIADMKGRKFRAASSNQILATAICTFQTLGANPSFVIYAGGAECCLATMKGDTDVTIQILPTVLRQAESSAGRLTPVTVFADSRAAVAPNLPSSKELGVTFPEDIKALLTYDWAIAAPPGLPADIKRILADAVAKTLADPNVGDEFKKAKMQLAVMTPEEMQKHAGLVAGAMLKNKKMIKELVSQ